MALLPEAQAAMAARLVAALYREAERVMPGACPLALRLEQASFVVVRDPVDGQPAFEGVWRDGRGHRCGGVVLNADDSYFAEFDLCVPHPDRPSWFVEAATAWGRDGVVKSELRLLQMPDEA
jgi:hypothetical protein